jgi:hypothetical protein
MHQAQATQRSAFEHVLQHHTLEFVMCDNELGQRIESLDEEVPAPRIVVGMAFPPTKRWSSAESSLDYLRILAYLPDHHYELEMESPIFPLMMLQVHENFRPELSLDEFHDEVSTKAGAIKLLTFLTGEEHPAKPMTWEGMFWDIRPIDQFLSNIQ